MKILYLANHLNTGGITRYLLSLSGGMIRRGHNIYVASGGGELEAEFIRTGAVCIKTALKTKCEFSPKVFSSFYQLLPLIKKYEIDIIHCNTRVAQVAGYLLSRCSGRPYVSTCHGFFKPRLGRRIFPCWGRRVIAISAQVRDHLINDLKTDEKMIVVINHGIDIGRFGPRSTDAVLAARKKFGLSADRPVIGIIARLSDVKGHLYLIEAMSEILRQFPGVLLWIIGSGPMENTLKALAVKLKIGKNVLWTPEAADTASALTAMDVFVMPSVKEGLGLALMEAMAAGLAVVGSDVGGIKTLIQDGENGLLAPVADSMGLAHKISSLLADPQKAARMAETARQRIAIKFPYESMIAQTELVYRQCLDQKD